MHPRLKHAHATCLHLELFLFCSASQWWKYCWPLLKAELFCGKGRQCWPVMRLLRICFADPNAEDLERSWAISPAALSTWRRQRRLEVNASWQAPTSCSVVVENITAALSQKKSRQNILLWKQQSRLPLRAQRLEPYSIWSRFFFFDWTNNVFWRTNLMTEWIEWA